jgi:hypothetical protein
MPREKENLEKVTVRLYIGDKEELNSFYPQLGYNKVVRKLITDHLKKLRERVNQKRSETNDDDDIDLSSIADFSLK